MMPFKIYAAEAMARLDVRTAGELQLSVVVVVHKALSTDGQRYRGDIFSSVHYPKDDTWDTVGDSMLI